MLDLTGNETVDDLLQAVTRARHLGCDVVRFDGGCPPGDERTTEDDSETKLGTEHR